MRKMIATLALAGMASFGVSQAQAVTNNVVFHAPTLESGTMNQVGSSYRFSNVLTGTDMLLKINAKSDDAVVDNVDGNWPFFTGANDNFILHLSRTAGSQEADTFVKLNFQFVDSGTSTSATADLSNATLTFGDIDSQGGQSFSDYVQLDPSNFASVGLASSPGWLEINSVDYSPEVRYIGDLTRGNIPNTSFDQPKISLDMVMNSTNGFDMTWGYQGAGDIQDRGLIMDGSNELASVTAVPEPASAALLGLGALSLLGVATRRRRSVA